MVNNIFDTIPATTIPEVDPGFTFDTSFNLAIAENNLIVNEAVGDGDQGDLYTFEVSETGDYHITLNGLSADADLWLLDARGEEVGSSQAYEDASESITTELAPGEYYAAVHSYDGVATDYTLNINPRHDSTTIPTEEETEAIIGTPEDDYLNSSFVDGTENNWYDNLYRGQDDIIKGLAGNDSLYGNAGNDQLFGGEGDDYLAGSTTPYYSSIWNYDYYEQFLYTSTASESAETPVSFDLIDGEEVTDGVDAVVDNYWLNYDWLNYGYIQDEVDTLSGGLGADTFVLGAETSSHYVDRFDMFDIWFNHCDALICNESHNEGQTNDYAIITDFSSTEGDVFQVYGDISQYTLETANWTGEEAMDTLIQYEGDTIGVVTDNTDINLEQNFVTVEMTFDLSFYPDVNYYDISSELI